MQTISAPVERPPVVKATRPFTLGLVIATLVGLLILTLLYRQESLLHDNQKWIEHSLLVQNAVTHLEMTALDGSNAIRGYVISGNPAFLQPYTDMNVRLMPEYQALLDLTADHPLLHFSELKAVLQQRMDESRLQHQLYTGPDSEAAKRRISAGYGLDINIRLRKLVTQMQAEESHRLLQHQAALTDSSKKAFFINLALVLLLMGVTTLTFFFLRRHISMRDQFLLDRDQMTAQLDLQNSNLRISNEQLHNANLLKNEFISAMSHELRTPLNSILGFTGLMRMGIPGPVNEEQKRELDMVEQGAKDLLHLINDLLDLSRIEAGRTKVDNEDFDLRKVVDKVLDTMTPMVQKKGLLLLTQGLESAITLHSDERMVCQVLLNLVSNAIKFTARGSITIACRKLEHQVEIRVIDQGTGIRTEQLGMLFQSFRQLDGTASKHYEGAGLGLYLCKKLMEMLGGDIRVESEFGKGSCFICTLPCTDNDAPLASS